MDIVERCSNYLSSGGLFNPELADHNAVRDLVINCRDEIERLREDLDLTQKIARIEIDAKIRYAWALSEIIRLKPDEEFGAVPIETAQRIASEALKWKE